MASKEGLVTRFKGGDLILEDGRLVREDLWVRNGRILDPLHLFYEEKKKADVVVDCSGLLISPGFIDIQINGKNTYICIRWYNYSMICQFYHASVNLCIFLF